MTCLPFWACATPTKAATVVRAVTADRITSFFILISPCSSRCIFHFFGSRVGSPIYTVSSPASPVCFEFALPTQTTLQRTGRSGSSSKITSTTCPRLTRQFSRSRKPSLEESSTRHGNLFGLRSGLTTRLARLLDDTRFERRALNTEGPDPLDALNFPNAPYDKPLNRQLSNLN